jgi:N-hydroxyarylamine O-acetyltransferase
MNGKQYLERIQYHETPRPDLAALAELQFAHMREVPFENLSIHYRQPIILDYSLLFTKIVEHRRGGFCYELNGLFGQLLKEIGFTVTLVSAEVSKGDGTFGPAFDHMALVVELGEAFLVDVGFGDSFRQPLRIHERGPQVQGATTYQISQQGEYYLLHQQSLQDPDAGWETQYRFTLQPRQLADFGGMCVYHQTSPDSHFTQKRVCSRATADGRVTLSDCRLIVTRGLVREEATLASEEEFLHALQAYFFIHL